MGVIELEELRDEKSSGINWKLCTMRRNVSLRVDENKVGFLGNLRMRICDW
jgi:hypothetical protein